MPLCYARGLKTDNLQNSYYALGKSFAAFSEYICLFPSLAYPDIAGLTTESAACEPFGSPWPGKTYRVAIALDDYAYSGIIATTHEVGHMYVTLCTCD